MNLSTTIPQKNLFSTLHHSISLIQTKMSVVEKMEGVINYVLIIPDPSHVTAQQDTYWTLIRDHVSVSTLYSYYTKEWSDLTFIQTR